MMELKNMPTDVSVTESMPGTIREANAFRFVGLQEENTRELKFIIGFYPGTSPEADKAGLCFEFDLEMLQNLKIAVDSGVEKARKAAQ